MQNVLLWDLKQFLDVLASLRSILFTKSVSNFFGFLMFYWYVHFKSFTNLLIDDKVKCQMLTMSNVNNVKLSTMSNCQQFQIVNNVKLSNFQIGKKSKSPNCQQCQIVNHVKLSNCQNAKMSNCQNVKISKCQNVKM